MVKLRGAELRRVRCDDSTVNGRAQIETVLRRRVKLVYYRSD
jgi:hypothetical protein